MASSRGMSYSGMPIAEQSRYVGEKYLPAMAQLKQQQTQQQYGLQTNINDIYSKRLTQAQALQQQELDREEAVRQAEAKRQQEERQFQQKLVADAQAARYSSGGGGGGRAPKQPSVDDAAALVNSLRSSGQYGDSQYGSIAEAMRQRGYDISRDSVYDRGLRKAFNFGYN